MSDHTSTHTPAGAHGQSPAAAHDASHGESHPHVNYMNIFYALCVLTVISVAIDYGLKGAAIPNPRLVVGGLVLAVAVMKASFVLMYFMHLKFEGQWKYVLMAPTIVLAGVLIVAIIPDIGVHYYTWLDDRVPPPVHGHGDAHGDPHKGGDHKHGDHKHDAKDPHHKDDKAGKKPH